MDVARQKLFTAASLAECADFALGPLVVSPATRTIARGDESEKIEPRIMQVLVVLAQANGAVVTRDTLLDVCWGGVYVGDDSLNRAIAAVRRIASGIGAGTFEVETIPRTGYRLAVCDVESEAKEAGAPDSPGTAPRIGRRWLLGGALAAAVGGAIVLRTGKSPPSRASQLMEESRVAMRAGTPEGTQKAVALLEDALKEEPENAAVLGLLALTRARADEHALSDTMFEAAQVDREANRALRLDPGNADAEAALAISIPFYGDWLNVERRFDAVLKKHPDHMATQDARCFFLGSVGLMRKAASDRTTFAEIDPFDASMRYRYVYALWFLDRIADADRVAAQGLYMWPRNPGLWFARLWVFAGSGRWDRAIAHIDDLEGRPALPPPMFDTVRLSLVAAQSKDPNLTREAASRVLGGAAQSVAGVVNAMMLLNHMQELDAAFALAEAYYLEKGPVIAQMQWRPGQPIVPDLRRRKTNMIFTPTAAPMQQDPRFMPLMEKMGLANYWEKKGVVPDFLA